jgi:hypothetical protein
LTRHLIFVQKTGKKPILIFLSDQEHRYYEVPHLGKSKKGMVNTDYKRYLARISKTYTIAKLGLQRGSV